MSDPKEIKEKDIFDKFDEAVIPISKKEFVEYMENYKRTIISKCSNAVQKWSSAESKRVHYLNLEEDKSIRHSKEKGYREGVIESRFVLIRLLGESF